MLFSSIEFLYFFMPLALLIYFLLPMPSKSPNLRNYWLLFVSLVFYAWGGPKYLILITAQSLAGWVFGLLIENRRGKTGRGFVLACSVIVGLGALIYFKYSDFFIENLNALLKSELGLLKLALPLGISFNTFQILSYNIDLHKGQIKVQRNFFTLFTYVALFPQLIAGPIVRYSTVEAELHNRPHTAELFYSGIQRFTAGLAKKVLIANVFAEYVELCRGSGDQSLLNAWMYIIAFAFQLYFDFSGYSDMAIGMGRMFGFKFLENFNYPYIARSVTDFWRRWHISLSSWFRDYIYIPLGGNRVKLGRHVFNIMVVWFVTGFWHGAGWNFIAWGVYFGLLLLAEKFFLGKIIGKAPRPVSHIYLIACVLIGWVFFDAANFGEAIDRLGKMFGAGVNGFAGQETLYYLRKYALPLVIAVIGCTPIPKNLTEKLYKSEKGKKLAAILEPLTIGALLIVVTAYLVDGSFNPFIYFRF